MNKKIMSQAISEVKEIETMRKKKQKKIIFFRNVTTLDIAKEHRLHCRARMKL